MIPDWPGRTGSHWPGTTSSRRTWRPPAVQESRAAVRLFVVRRRKVTNLNIWSPNTQVQRSVMQAHMRGDRATLTHNPKHIAVLAPEEIL